MDAAMIEGEGGGVRGMGEVRVVGGRAWGGMGGFYYVGSVNVVRASHARAEGRAERADKAVVCVCWCFRLTLMV